MEFKASVGDVVQFSTKTAFGASCMLRFVILGRHG